MINITPSQELTKIYLVTNCYGDPNKIYIGKTKNKTRKSNHKKTYGKDIIFTYIDEINSLHRKDWQPLECFWIEYFRQFGFNLQNKNNGGNGIESHSFETKTKISKILKGKGVKPILQYDLEGNFVREWIGIWYAENELNLSGISKSCKSKRFQLGKYQWFYKNDDEIKLKIDKYLDPTCKPILQYNLDGNFIQEWDSLSKAITVYGESLKQCCNKRQKTAYNFLWYFKTSNDYLNKINPYIKEKRVVNIETRDKLNKSVIQYSIENLLIKEYKSMKEAEKNTGISQYNISSCVRNKQKTAGGFKWGYKT